MGQSGRLGSETTKLCWMRSSVVAKSRPAREGSGVSRAAPPSDEIAWNTTRQAKPVARRGAQRTCKTSPTDPALLAFTRESYFTSSGTPEPAHENASARAVEHHARAAVSSNAPSANAEHEPSVVRVTSTWTPMYLATVPSASLTGAAGVRMCGSACVRHGGEARARTDGEEAPKRRTILPGAAQSRC